ncbi:colanic acid/amylovoran biosynthesis glycosyltransferase [Mesonia phycicola]|uniref:Colanic acid/amylovoran biosynthesis glycosyltransferase n=1 Tax=Mesonia phycicola TaxID=579105 RepID=A0A1M6AMJ4_9FLAO|nr:glycosyltransferase family 4 protein [Mesonia phycicola]SHI37665.1 colanic acid/amylovoran biosynthesis glycosyltransferase [Mesonia phycicola]
MKIIIFDGTFETTAFIRRLLIGLVDSKHKVYVLGFNTKLKNRIDGVEYVSLGANDQKKKLLLTSLQLQKFSLSCFINILKGNRKALQKTNLKVVLQQIKPDIIHAQWNSILPWLAPVLKSQVIPVVLSQRGYHTNVRPFVNENNFSYLKEIYPELAGIHSVSKAIEKKGNLIGVPSITNQVVHTGLDFSKFPSLSLYKKRDTLHILSVGRTHWIKGYDIALKACALLKKNGVPFTYTIIGGEGEEELLFFKSIFHLDQEVTLLGRVSQEEVYQKMQECSLLLLPSIEEGIANVVVEAMALGTPVISTDCGGMTELITHEKEGWIVPKRNTEAMATSIQSFSKLKVEEIEKVRKAARQKVEADFNEEQMVTGMINLYKNVLNGKA